MPVFECVNCGRPIPERRYVKLYCSDLCAQEAEYVRYHRACIADARDKRPDIKQALSIRLAHVLSGGYPETERRVPGRVRLAVIRRAGGKCQRCGKPGSVIHHIDGSDNTLRNLELLCSVCHDRITLSRLTPLSPNDTEKVVKAKELEFRSRCELPLKECDDHKRWPAIYREIRETRKAAFANAVVHFVRPLLAKRLTRRQVCDRLNDRGVPTFSGHGVWNTDSLRRLLRRTERLS